MRRLARDQRGLGIIEIALVLIIVAIVGSLIYRYVGSTAKQVEKFKEDRPLAHTRLAADQATLASMQRSAADLPRHQRGQAAARQGRRGRAAGGSAALSVSGR